MHKSCILIVGIELDSKFSPLFSLRVIIFFITVNIGYILVGFIQARIQVYGLSIATLGLFEHFHFIINVA